MDWEAFAVNSGASPPFALLTPTIFLIADSTKISMTVTFYDVSLRQAVQIEEILQDEFEEYNYSIEINKAISDDYNWLQDDRIIAPIYSE